MLATFSSNGRHFGDFSATVASKGSHFGNFCIKKVSFGRLLHQKGVIWGTSAQMCGIPIFRFSMFASCSVESYMVRAINPHFNLLRGSPPPRILTAPPFYPPLEWGMPGAQNACKTNGFCTNASQNAAELRALMSIDLIL